MRRETKLLKLPIKVLYTSSLMKQVIDPSPLSLVELEPVKLQTFEYLKSEIALEYIDPSSHHEDIDRSQAYQDYETFYQIILVLVEIPANVIVFYCH